jgi:hypothetical protein
MAKQLINIGSLTNDGTGDTLRIGAQKINANFTELYAFLQNSQTGQLSLVSSIIAGEGIQVNSPSGAVQISQRTATSTSVGAVRAGETLVLSEGGVLDYNLPTATDFTIGGIIAGDTLSITESGVLDYNLPIATDTELGGVKVDGVTITIDESGVISTASIEVFDQVLNTDSDVEFNKVTASEIVITGTPFKLPYFTTSARDAITAENGYLIYNTTTNKIQGYQNGSWVDLSPDLVDGGTAPN